MIKISHRGNVSGPNPGRENTSEYIDEAIALGYVVELDIWKNGHRLYMTNECKLSDRTEVNIEWLRARKNEIVIHCKDVISLQFFSCSLEDWHYYFHESDSYTLTSSNWIWAYPGSSVREYKPTDIYNSADCISICNLPELNKQDVSLFAGVCSDYIENY